VLVTPLGDRELEVAILGSQVMPFQRLELETRLRVWRLAHPDVGVFVTVPD
jgi:hypothetical protein